ncbi:hypothetical protein GCM10023192_85650 [Amycolatopsis samaneae]
MVVSSLVSGFPVADWISCWVTSVVQSGVDPGLAGALGEDGGAEALGVPAGSGLPEQEAHRNSAELSSPAVNTRSALGMPGC